MDQKIEIEDFQFQEIEPQLPYAEIPENQRDYVDILRSEYIRRKKKNPLYSVRAFAMHLRIHVSALSRILNRKQALSLKAASVVVRNLDLSSDEQARLLLSIASQRVDDIVDRLSRPLDSRLRISFEQAALS